MNLALSNYFVHRFDGLCGCALFRSSADDSDAAGEAGQGAWSAVRGVCPGGGELCVVGSRGLAGAGQNAYALQRPGFQYEQVLAIDLGLGNHGYTPATARAYLDQSPPLVNENVTIAGIQVDGRRVLIYPNRVGPEFFETLGVPVLRVPVSNMWSC